MPSFFKHNTIVKEPASKRSSQVKIGTAIRKKKIVTDKTGGDVEVLFQFAFQVHHEDFKHIYQFLIFIDNFISSNESILPMYILKNCCLDS